MPPEIALSPLRVLSTSRCSRCYGILAVQRIAPSRPGFEQWTLRCTSCGRIQQRQVVSSPSQSEPLDWCEKELVNEI